MSLISNPKDGDNVSIRQAVAKLGVKLGPTSSPTFASVTTTTLTISGLTTNSLIYPVSGLLTSLGVATNGQIPIGSTGVAPVLATLTGTANEIDITSAAGSITIGIVNPLIVGKGGSGAATFTDHSLLLGSGADAFTALGTATDGQLPIGSTGLDPVLATLTEGAGITVTNAAGSITIATTISQYTNESAQDAVGGILDDGTVGNIVFTYDDAGGVISAVTQDAEIDHDALLNVHQNVNTDAIPTLAGLKIADAGYIGSVSDTDAIQIEAGGNVVLSQSIGVGITPARNFHVYGTTPEFLFERDGLPANQRRWNVFLGTTGDSPTCGSTFFRALNDAGTGGGIWLMARHDNLNVGFGGVSPTAHVHIAAGAAAANLAPLKFNTGINLTTPEAGAMEFDGTNLYFTPAAARKTIVITDSSPTLTDLTITTPSSIYSLSHDSFADFAAAEHYLQTAITNVSTALATGLLKVTTGTGALSVITDSSANWNTAYGWGDHAGLYESTGAIATHAALTATHGVSGAVVGTTDSQALTTKTYNALTLIAAATGFTIAGGTTPKTLTVDDAFVVSTQLAAIGLNTAKNTNVPTALSTGTIAATTYGITSDGGADDVILAEATTSLAGLLGAAKWNEIVANTAKQTNVSTSLSVGTVGINTVAITSDGGADDVTLPAATVDTAGMLTTAKWAEIVSNTSHRGLASGNPHSVTPTELSLVIGTNTQAHDAGLTNLAAVAMAADKFYYTSADNVHVAGTVTTAGRAILDDSTAAAQATTLGLGTGNSPAFVSETLTGCLNLQETLIGLDTYTKLLLHFDGTDALTTITDSSLSQHVPTVVADAQIDTAQNKFGGASCLFDGTGDYITIPDHTDWNFGSGNFTIDTWVYPTSGATSHSIFAGTSDFWLGIVFNLYPVGGLKVGVCASSNGTSWNLFHPDAGGAGVGTISLTLNAWSHIAFVRNGNNWRTYINGVLDVNTTVAGTLTTKAEAKNIGRWGGDGLPKWLGWIDEFRVSKGIARWTAAFTPPTRAYGDGIFGRLNIADHYEVDGTQVVSNQGAAVTDATDAASVITQLNALLARCRTHGLIAT